MTGADYQKALDGIVTDLQTKGRGKTVYIMFRSNTGAPNPLPISSGVDGVVNAAQLAAVQGFVDAMKPLADSFVTTSAPVKASSESFKTARENHEALIVAARNARVALNDALEADATYQTAKTSLDAAKSDPAFVAARNTYESENVSENFSALVKARGEYAV